MAEAPEGRADTELGLRYLADVQSVISRLSQNSFVVRGWSVTLVSIVFAVSSNRQVGLWTAALASAFPALIFWGLDAYYLRQERLFRALYRSIGEKLQRGEALVLFDMNLDGVGADVPSLQRTLFTGHVVAIPAMLLLILVACLVAMA